MKIDGKQIAAGILEKLEIKVLELKKKGVRPHLVVILVGDNPASKSYVSQKKIKGEEIGTKVTIMHVLSTTPESELLKIIEQLNYDSNVHGIIVQRPLPEQIEETAVANAINPKKDVDGFHPQSKFSMPLGVAVLKIIEEIHASTPGVEPQKFIAWLSSKNIVVIGKGETGGGPTIQLLKNVHIEPKIIDSKTHNPSLVTKKADILISAVGKQHVIKANMLRKNVMLISVGMHKGEDGKLHGDYEEEEIKNIASFYTPTPGGVGPVNVAMLLKNLIHATDKA